MSENRIRYKSSTKSKNDIVELFYFMDKKSHMRYNFNIIKILLLEVNFEFKV
ncbi:MAG: hypothetical protein ACRDAU_02810 [Clostridium sp.]